MRAAWLGRDEKKPAGCLEGVPAGARLCLWRLLCCLQRAALSGVGQRTRSPSGTDPAFDFLPALGAKVEMRSLVTMMSGTVGTDPGGRKRQISREFEGASDEVCSTAATSLGAAAARSFKEVIASANVSELLT